MNISVNCKVSISKKLRSLLGKSGSITLVVPNIEDGKGNGVLSLDSETLIEQIDTTETSIMITPIEIASYSPNVSDISQGILFTTTSSRGDKEDIVRKIASVNPPERGQEHTSIKKNIDVPKAFTLTKNPECKKWIEDMTSLVEAVNEAKNKKSEVDISVAKNDREKAVLMEMKEKSESIDVPAWVVNEKIGVLSINDLNINLPLNSPFDLSNISAKRIAASKDLKMLLRDGHVRLVSPKEKNEIVSRASGEEESDHGLEIFDRHEQAEDSIKNSTSTRHASPIISEDKNSISTKHSFPVINDETADDLTEEDIQKPLEEESMIINLTQNMPIVKESSALAGGETRKTVHSNDAVSQSQKPNIKPIKKLI